MARVLHITDKPHQGGGIAQSITAQSNAARAAGWQAERLRIGPGATIPIRFTASAAAGAATAEAFRTQAARPEYAPDLVHLHLGFTAINPALIAEMARIAPLVVQLHDVSAFCPNGTRMRQPDLSQCSAKAGLACLSGACAGHGRRMDLLRALAFAPARRAVWRALRSHAKRIIAPSAYLADLARAAGADPARLVVLPHAVDLPAPARRTRPSDCPPVIAYVGRLDLLKGPSLALDMMRHLPDAAELLIIGDGPDREMLEARCAALRLEPRVRFAGWMDRAALADALAGVRCVIQPSLIPEGFGLTIIEAAALARPVAGFGRGATAELLTPHGAIASAPTGAALADAVRPWLDDPARADADGLAARTRAQAHDAALVSRQLMALYHQLCPDLPLPTPDPEGGTKDGTQDDTKDDTSKQEAETCAICA